MLGIDVSFFDKDSLEKCEARLKTILSALTQSLKGGKVFTRDLAKQFIVFALCWVRVKSSKGAPASDFFYKGLNREQKESLFLRLGELDAVCRGKGCLTEEECWVFREVRRYLLFHTREDWFMFRWVYDNLYSGKALPSRFEPKEVFSTNIDRKVLAMKAIGGKLKETLKNKDAFSAGDHEDFTELINCWVYVKDAGHSVPESFRIFAGLQKGRYISFLAFLNRKYESVRKGADDPAKLREYRNVRCFFLYNTRKWERTDWLLGGIRIPGKEY